MKAGLSYRFHTEALGSSTLTVSNLKTDVLLEWPQLGNKMAL